MVDKKPTSYEGNENYIFISYAHSDSEAVYRILNTLEEKGYRFWYDDGIAPGSEWPEDIAQHLNNAALFIAFITNNSVQSSNCRREINYALSKEKPFLSVVLEQSTMSPGLEMQLSSHQSIIKYNYRSEQEFLSKLLNTAALETCRIPEPVITDEEHEEEPKTEPAEKPAKEPAPVTSAAADAVKPKAARPKNNDRTGGADASGKKKILLPVIIGASVLALALVLMLTVFSSFKTSWGDSIKSSETSLLLRDNTITREDFEKIASLKKLSQISFSDCVFEDTSGVSFTSDELFSVTLENCSGVNDYGFLAGHALVYLAVSGDDSFNDISSIDTEKLKYIDISGTGVTDISVLADSANLTELVIADTPVKDISAVSSIPSLMYLNCCGSDVTSLEPAAGLEELKKLYFDGCKVKIPGKLKTLYLEELSCSGCGLSDLTPFSDQTRLTKLDISNNDIADIKWLNSHNYDTLTYIDISGTSFDRETLDFIEKCTNVTELRIRGMNDLGNIGFCSKLPDLEVLFAEGSGIGDISGLKGCANLKNIRLSYNNIEDISSLASLKPEDTILDLSHNNIRDLSKLSPGEYHTILITGNGKNVATTIPAKLTGNQLAADWCDGILESTFVKDEAFGTVYLVGIPANEQISAEEAIGSYVLKSVTEKELYEILKEGTGYFSLSDDSFDYAASLSSTVTSFFSDSSV